MPEKTPTLAEAAPHLIPKKWADSARERSKQVRRLQLYFHAEGYYAEVGGEMGFGVEVNRAKLMSELNVFYGGILLPWQNAGDLLVDKTSEPVVKFITKQLLDPIRNAFQMAVSPLLRYTMGPFEWLWNRIKFVYNKLLGIGSTIYDWAKSAIEDTVGGIVSTAQDIWNAVENIGQTIWSQAYSAVSSAISGIVSTAGDIWGAVKNLGQTVLQYTKRAINIALGPIEDVLTAIRGYFQRMWSALERMAGGIVSLPQKIWNGLTTVAKWIKQIPGKIWGGLQLVGQWIKQIPSKVWEGMKKLGGWIYEGLSTAVEFIQDKIWPIVQSGLDSAWHAVRSGLNWLFTKVWDTMAWALDKAINFGHVLVNTLTTSFKKLFTSIAGQLGDFYNWTMQEMVIAPLRHMRGESSTIPGVPKIVDTVGDISQELYQTLREGIEYEPPASFEKAEDAAGDFLSYGLLFGGLDSMTTLTEESLTIARGMATGQTANMINMAKEGVLTATDPLKQWPKLAEGDPPPFGGIAKFFKSAYYALGLGFMMWTIWSGSLRAIMADPREEYYRRVYKTKYPAPSQQMDMFRAQLSTPVNNDDWLSVMGWNPMYREQIRKTSWKRLSSTQAKEMWNRGLISEATLNEELMYQGYKRPVMNKVIQNVKMDALQDRWDDMSDAYEDAYETGTVSYDEALKKLQGYGYPKKKAEYTLKSIDKERTADFREDVVDELVDLLEDGEITEDKFMREASKFIVQPHLLQRYMMLAAIERGDIGQIGTVGSVDQRMDQLKHRIKNLSKQIDRLVDERSKQREIYGEKIKALKNEIGKKNELTDPEAKAKIEKLRERMEKKDEEYGERIRSLREEREELQLDLEAMEGYKVAG